MTGDVEKIAAACPCSWPVGGKNCRKCGISRAEDNRAFAAILSGLAVKAHLEARKP